MTTSGIWKKNSAPTRPRIHSTAPRACYRGHPPHLGQNTDDVLDELPGLRESAGNKLRESGILWSAVAPGRLSMSVSVTFVGSGDSFGSGGRFNTCFLVD